MVEITSREEFSDWLEGKPITWAQVLSARMALRVTPYVFDDRIDSKSHLDFYPLVCRAILTAWIVPQFSWHDIDRTSARIVSRLLQSYKLHVGPRTSSLMAYFVRSACECAANMNNSARAHAATTAVFASSSLSESVSRKALHTRPHDYAYVLFSKKEAASAFWANLSVDCEWLHESNDHVDAAQRLNRKNLWVVHPPFGLTDALQQSRERLLGLGPNLQVWIDWYERRIVGDPAAFLAEVNQDRKILLRIANSSDEEFWGKGTEYVYSTIQIWIKEFFSQHGRNSIENNESKIPINANIIEDIPVKKVDFFISYATKDEVAAREVEYALTQAGYTSIAQFKDFKKGNFVRLMRESLAQADRFIALQSRAYWASDHCQAEWDAAYARDPGAKLRKIVPFLLEPTTLPPIASELVYLPLFGISDKQRNKAIVDWIEWRPDLD